MRDLSGQIADIDGAALAPSSLARLAALDPAQLPLVEENVRFGPPVGGTRNFIAVGLNYAEHVAEAGRELPEEPVLFNKAPSCISGADDGFLFPGRPPARIGRSSWQW